MVVHNYVSFYHWSSRKSWLAIIFVVPTIFLPYGQYISHLFKNIYQFFAMVFEQHLCLLLQVFSDMNPFFVQNIGSVYPGYSIKVGQHFYLYLHLFYCPTAFQVSQKVLIYAISAKWQFGQHFCLLFQVFCPELIWCKECCLCIPLILKESWATLMPLYSPIFLSYSLFCCQEGF